MVRTPKCAAEQAIVVMLSLSTYILSAVEEKEVNFEGRLTILLRFSVALVSQNRLRNARCLEQQVLWSNWEDSITYHMYTFVNSGTSVLERFPSLSRILGKTL